LTRSQTNRFEGALYCGKCWNLDRLASKQAVSTKSWKKSGTSGTGSSKYGGGSVLCNMCQKAAFSVERSKIGNYQYHTNTCLICFECKVNKTSALDLKHFKGPNKGDVEIIVCSKCWKSEGYVNKQAASAKKKNMEQKKKLMLVLRNLEAEVINVIIVAKRCIPQKRLALRKKNSTPNVLLAQLSRVQIQN